MAKATVKLNPRLLEEQKVSQKNHDNLLHLHRRLDEYLIKLNKAKKILITNPNHQKSLKLKDNSIQKIQNFEFKMQKHWDFSIDARYHIHWKRNPFCSSNPILSQEEGTNG